MSRKPARLTERPLREDLVRAACLECLGAILQEGQLADRVLQRVLRRESRLYSSERRTVAERVYAVLRRKGTLDFAIDRALKKMPLTSGERDCIRLAGARLLEGEALPTVKASSGVSVSQLRALDFLGDLPAHIERLADLSRVAVLGSVPEFIAELLLAEMERDEALALLASLNSRGPLTVRANLLKITREALIAKLAGEAVASTPARWAPCALSLDTRINAFSLEAFKSGHFEIQDEGSQILALALGARPGEQIVDACSGSGGKALALAAMMQNQGEVFALDADSARLAELKPRARRAGASIIRSRAIPKDATAAAAFRDLESRADRVLVDAPCSGLGALRRNPDARWRLRPEDLPRFAEIQKTLLQRFSLLVKPGGLLVYATCSFARVEDEEVAGGVQLPGFERASVAELLGSLGGPLGAALDLRLWPHRHGTDGFYAAAFRRRA